MKMDSKDGTIPNESTMKTHSSSSFSSDELNSACLSVIRSDTEIDIARCRSLGNCVGHVAATRDPEEILLMQTNLKLRLRNLSKYIELPIMKPCNEQKCPMVKQRLEQHRHRCRSAKNTKISNLPKDEECSTSVAAMPVTCDQLAQTVSKKIKDEATICERQEKKENIQDAVAEVRQSIQTTSTMTAFEVLRRTRSCNTTVSFKNFYKDRLQHEVLQWLREVPIEAEFNSARRIITERIVNDLIEKVYKLFSKANSDSYEVKLKSLIGCCLNSLPVSYHSAKCDKTKHILTESLVTRIVMLNNKYIFAPSTSTSGLQRLYPCGFDDFETYTSKDKLTDIPVTKFYRKETLNWLHSKRLKRKDDRVIDTTEVTETLLDRLLPLLYDREIKNCKYLMMGSIIEVLDKFPLVFTGNNKRLYLNGLAAELTTILLKTRSGYESSTRSSSACSGSFRDFLSNPKNFLRQLRKRRAVKECLAENCSDYNYNSIQASSYDINFFRLQGHRLMAAVSSEVTKFDVSHTNLTTSDLIFKSIQDGLDELSILYSVNRNFKRSNESYLLHMTFNFNENINIKATCHSDIFEFGYESLIRNKSIYYGLMFMVWIGNKSVFHNVLNNQQFKPKLTDNGTCRSTKTLNISERETLRITNLLKFMIEYGSFKTDNNVALLHKHYLLVKLKKLSAAPLPNLNHDSSAIFKFTKIDIARGVMVESSFKNMLRNINLKRQLIPINNTPGICRRANKHVLDQEITYVIDIKVKKSQDSNFMSSSQYFTNHLDITF